MIVLSQLLYTLINCDNNIRTVVLYNAPRHLAYTADCKPYDTMQMQSPDVIPVLYEVC